MLSEVLHAATRYLRDSGVSTPRLDAEVILAHILGVERSRLYLDPGRSLAEGEISAYKEAIERRARGVPVAYITGKKEFMSLEFMVDERVLIPRPETELLVEATVRNWRSEGWGSGLIVDVGTGCGAIAVALARLLPRIRVIATDISAEALDVARANAEAHGVVCRIDFFNGHLLCPVFDASFGGRVDAIVSNPPYLSCEEMASLQKEVSFEPAIALRGGKDGLDFYREIVPEASVLLKPGGFLAVEVGAKQDGEVRAMASSSGGFGRTEVIRDYSGIGRVVIAKKTDDMNRVNEDVPENIAGNRDYTNRPTQLKDG